MLMKKSLFLTALEKFLMELRNSTDMFENGMILHPDQQKALKNAKKVNKKGKIIDQEGKIGSC